MERFDYRRDKDGNVEFVDTKTGHVIRTVPKYQFFTNEEPSMTEQKLRAEQFKHELLEAIDQHVVPVLVNEGKNTACVYSAAHAADPDEDEDKIVEGKHCLVGLAIENHLSSQQSAKIYECENEKQFCALDTAICELLEERTGLDFDELSRLQFLADRYRISMKKVFNRETFRKEVENFFDRR